MNVQSFKTYLTDMIRADRLQILSYAFPDDHLIWGQAKLAIKMKLLELILLW